MKLKGVNPFEQHVDKIVVGVTGAALLGVIAMQFVTNPNQVETGNRKVGPDQIYTELEGTASSLQSQISDRSPTLPDVQDVDLVARYNSAFDSASSSTLALSSPLGDGVDVGSGLRIEIDTGVGPGVGPVVALNVPTTTQPIAVSNWATLDPYTVLELPEYEAYIPNAQPFDFASVSVETEFSGTQLRKVLEGADGGGGVPPRFWISTGMAVMGLEVERQQRLADGSWSSASPIDVPPGTPLPNQSVTKDDGLVRLNEMIALAKEASPLVMRPFFPPTISGPEWEPPSEGVETSSQGVSEIDRLRRQLTRYQDQLEQMSGSGRSGRNSASSGRTASRDRDRGRGSTSSRGNNSGNNDARRTQIENKIESIQQRLERLGAAIDVEIEEQDLLELDNIQLWAHDLGIQPGATYRYRTRVVLKEEAWVIGEGSDDNRTASRGNRVTRPSGRGTGRRPGGSTGGNLNSLAPFEYTKPEVAASTRVTLTWYAVLDLDAPEGDE